MKSHQNSQSTRLATIGRSRIPANHARKIVAGMLALAGLACLMAAPAHAQYNDPYYASGPSAAYGYDVRGYRPGIRRGNFRFWRSHRRSRYRDTYRYRDHYGRRAAQRARRAAAKRLHRAELRRAARRAEKRRRYMGKPPSGRQILGSPSSVIQVSKKGAGRIRRTARIYVAPPIAPGPLGRFLNDRTLRRGDVVTTPRGLMVFVGKARASRHSDGDFRPLRRATRITGKKLAGQLRTIERAIRRNRSSSISRQVGKSYKQTASTAELPSKSAKRL